MTFYNTYLTTCHFLRWSFSSLSNWQQVSDVMPTQDTRPTQDTSKTPGPRRPQETCFTLIKMIWTYKHLKQVSHTHINFWMDSLTLNVQGLSYLGLTRSISWLLMPWLLTHGSQQSRRRKFQNFSRTFPGPLLHFPGPFLGSAASFSAEYIHHQKY